MQAEQHLGKPKRAPSMAMRDWQASATSRPAAETEAMDDRDRRQLECLQMIDDGMRGADARFHHLGIAGAAEFVDVGAGDEADGFAERITRPAGRSVSIAASTASNSSITSEDSVLALVPARSEQQPGDAVGIARQLEIVIRAGRDRASARVAVRVRRGTSMIFSAMITPSRSAWRRPGPPPMHSVAMPRRVPSRFMALTEMQHDAVARRCRRDGRG
jgi:hypothetical protein